MSLRINHNLAALNAHRNLLQTNSDLSRSMQRLSSGFRINQGSDNPAGLVISEQFRAQIAGLNRAVENSEGSINMIQTAEGALTEINNLLISMRELAIHAANEGFNDADQLAADQAEITNAIATIDRIAANTQFGTKKLLDGSKENVASITTANGSEVTIKQSGLSTGTHFITAYKSADPTASLNVTTGGITLAGVGSDGDPYNLAEAVHNIDVVQASGSATKTSTSAIAVTDFWDNGIKLNTTATKALMASGLAFAQADADATYTFRVNYQENGGTPTGYVTIQAAVASGEYASDLVTAFNAALVGTALEGKVEAEGTGVGAGSTFGIKSVSVGSQFSMAWTGITAETTGTAAAALTGLAAGSHRGASTNTFTLQAVTASITAAADIAVTVASNTYSTLADLVTALNTVMATTVGQVAGTSTAEDVYAQVWDNDTIRFSTRDQGSAYTLQLMAGADATTGNLRNVLNLTADTTANVGQDALVTLDGYANALSQVDYDQAKEYTLKSAADGELNQGTVKINVEKAESGLELNNFLLDVAATKFNVQLDGGAATEVKAGFDYTIWNTDRTEWMKVQYALTSTGGTETISNIDQSLVFQIGANVGQTAQISLRNMSASSLGKHLPGNMFTDLSKIDVTTVQGAQDAQSVIDSAINLVSTTRGTLGSFQKNTLESNLRNLRIAAQNLTASESQLRDTDMAKEMSEFTKNQILVQAGTAMLAQANQIPQIVMSLF